MRWFDLLLGIGGLTPAGNVRALAIIRERWALRDRIRSMRSTIWRWMADSGHVPWPSWAREFVLDEAPEDLCRLVRLGVATCQRESDLVRMGPRHREHTRGRNGIWCRPKKTKKKRRTFFIPLATTETLELDRWESAPMTFRSGRWGHTTTAHNAEVYLYSPTGAQYSPDGLRWRWHRWLATKAGQTL